MKITKSQLKEIIKEEVSRFQTINSLKKRKKQINEELRMLNEGSSWDNINDAENGITERLKSNLGLVMNKEMIESGGDFGQKIIDNIVNSLIEISKEEGFACNPRAGKLEMEDGIVTAMLYSSGGGGLEKVPVASYSSIEDMNRNNFYINPIESGLKMLAMNVVGQCNVIKDDLNGKPNK